MSVFYIQVEQIAKESFKREKNWKKFKKNFKLVFNRDKKLIITFLILELLLLSSSLFIWYFKVTNWAAIFFLILFIILIHDILKRLDNFSIASSHEELENFKTGLERHGFKDKEQIEMVQNEIARYIDSEKTQTRYLLSFLGKLFLFLFWVPAGFLLSYYFNTSNEFLDFGQLIDIIKQLLIISIMIIGLTLSVSPLLFNLYNLISLDRKRLYLYLEDVKYYYSGCSLRP